MINSFTHLQSHHSKWKHMFSLYFIKILYPSKYLGLGSCQRLFEKYLEDAVYAILSNTVCRLIFYKLCVHKSTHAYQIFIILYSTMIYTRTLIYRVYKRPEIYKYNKVKLQYLCRSCTCGTFALTAAVN